MSAATNAAPAPDAPPPSPVPATLRWNSGELIPGEIAEATAAELTWKTPLFEDPLLLGWHALHRVDQSLAATPPADSFAFSLRDGSHLYGELTATTDSSVSLHSSRHGDATLKRSEVLSVRRIKARGSLLFAGPSGDVGWEASPVASDEPSNGSSAPTIPLLTVGPGGALMMPYWNRDAFLSLTLPEIVNVEFCVRSSKRPDFQLMLEDDPARAAGRTGANARSGSRLRQGAQGKSPLRIETWDDELVLAADDEFKTIRKIAENERDVTLRILWDRQSRRCSVFTPEGELIAEWQAPENSASQSSGFALQNKGRDLSLDFLRVREWDGQLPPKVDPRLPRVELADGRVIQAQISSASAASISLPSDAPDARSSFPLADVDAIVFSADPPKPGDQQPAALSYADGTVLSGSFASVKDGWASLKTSFAETPLAVRLEGLRQCRIKMAAPEDEALELGDLDTIAIQQTRLHGRLVGVGDDQPRWLPVGGVRPAMPSKSLPSEITRAFPPGAAFPGAPALFYTNAGDVLPGRLRALDRSGAQFESGFVEATNLPADALDAVQFTEAAAQPGPQDFNDAGWRVLKGNDSSVKKTKDSLKMEADTALGHPSAMQSSEIKFNFDPASWSAVRLRMFCAGTDAARSVNLVLFQYNGRFISGLETTDGQVDSQSQLKVPSNAVAVRLLIDEKKVSLYVNGSLTQTFPIDRSKRAGAGLIIEPSSMWGNNVSAISLSGFSSSSAPGQIRLPDVNEESKTQALTVPRFRRDDPPRNVILAANGDVLRGEIEAATASHFAFRAGLENLRVPRERVKAAIWLKKPDESAPPPSVGKSPVLKLLEQKIEQGVRYSSGGLSSFVNYLQQEAPGLIIQLPAKRESRRFPMQFGGRTIGESLDQICALFGLSYRISGAGEIVLEAGVPAPKTGGQMQKVYWLKADAFPKVGSVREILLAKGIPFPDGAAALWQPDARQLSMANTAANHEKLVKLLETDFGGSLGSPTHWLMLASGARLGITVDKFEKDTITGHHPAYGRCTAPLSQICVIRNTPPEPTTAMESLKGWRLVYAPEPVLPETGGESSPMLGKAAPAFKLSMLGGGNFDLAQEKGHVVVLDFWATWCGPCINSLPGLIEAMSVFPADRVKLIGVNQSEPAEQVKRFLETRGWKLAVAMDAGQNVARQYGVDGIPHTVIVGPDGKVAWVKTGYSPDGDTETANAVKGLLAPASAPDAAKPEPVTAKVPDKQTPEQ